ncbi:MAG: GspE/PulE family protein [Casimicrobiaceae bacterium]|nr:GspE/PulE family protein [Casimicrobiaceae bacterium]MCX8097864.1 GspE/PulE family protein [Casimicrobiaceae bacterium]MDW8311345.1 GspE/PulE family protein [Burkholderiales bacterium]
MAVAQTSVPPSSPTGDRPLTLDFVLDELARSGMVEQRLIEELRSTSRFRNYDHPLVLIAEQKWRALAPPHRLITLEALTEWLAQRLNVPYVHIDPLKVDFSAVSSVMSSTYAQRYRILPIEVTGDRVVVATSEPFVRSWIPEISQLLRRKIELVFANPLDVKRYVVEFFSLAQSVKRAHEASVDDKPAIASFEQLVQLGAQGATPDANDRHIVRIVDWLWQYAFEQRASDIHLEPRRDQGIVRFRIDGVLHQVYQIPPPVMTAMVSRIKLLARMEIVEKRRPQDGRIKTQSPEGEEIELRVSTMPTAFGEKVVMRIFDPEVLLRDFRELGFSDEDVARWNEMVRRPYGIVLVTGPTGSGKTTTLYSTLKQLATPEVNVCTVEDPIEMIEPAFNQMQVQPQIGVDFESGIRALLRQDPDIMMVGEIRDLATAEMAVQAALTGHLVLSTLHTNDAPGAITRLIDLGVPPYLVNATLIGVMAQRLVRTLCPKCKAPAELSDETWQALTRPYRAPRPAKIYRPVGCLECRMTGYQGRIGLFETMLMTAELKKRVLAGAELDAIREQAYREGMKPLRVSGAQKIAQGLTSLEEVEAVAPPD